MTPDFWRLQVARFASIVGLQLQGVAVAWEVYAITHHALDLGLVGLAQFLPALLLAPITGQVADRVDRRIILRLCWAAQVGLAIALFVLSRAKSGVIPIYIVLGGVSMARAFSAPAAAALVADLVPHAKLSRAIAIGSSIWQLAVISGPATGGALFAWRGGPTVYLCAAVLFFIGFVMVSTINTIPARSDRPSTRESVLAGVKYVWNKRIIFATISLDLFAVLLGGAVALMPMFAKDVLEVGPRGLGILRGAPGVGAAAMALLMAAKPLRRREGFWVLSCVMVFGLATIGFGLSRTFWLSVGLLVVAGAVDMVSAVIRATMVQTLTPPEMRGRVSAVNMVFIGASNELGEFESGLTAEWLGPVRATVLGGIGTVLVVIVWSVLFPALRRADQLDKH